MTNKSKTSTFTMITAIAIAFTAAFSISAVGEDKMSHGDHSGHDKKEMADMVMVNDDKMDHGDMEMNPIIKDKKDTKAEKKLEEKSTWKKTNETTVNNGDHGKAVYACPMHPEVTSNKPGERCPKCGMHLVRVDRSSMGQTSEVRDRSAVKISYFKEQKIGVKTVKVVKKPLFKSVKAPGRVAFDPELYTAQGEYIEALKQYDRVKNSPLKEVKRSTKEMIRSAEIRLKIMGLSDGEIKKLARKKHLNESLLFTTGSEGWIYADIFEMDIPFIEKGLSAEIRANFLMGEVLAASVISVDEVIDKETRTAKVRLKLTTKDAPKIRPQSYVSVEIIVPAGTHIAIPVDSVMDTGRETFVFVKSGEGEFTPRLVTIMFEAEGMAAIAKGLSVNEDVVAQANFMIDSEARLKSVIRTNIDGSAAAPMTDHSQH